MPSKTQSVLLGGLALGVAATLLSLIPFVGGCLACAGYVGAGMLAVWHYTSTYELTVPAGQGVVMGLGAGIVAALVGAALGFVLREFGLLPDAEAVLQQMEDSGQLDQMGPDMAAQMEGIIAAMFGWAGILIGMVVGGILGLIGGAIGAASFKYGEDPTAI